MKQLLLILIVSALSLANAYAEKKLNKMDSLGGNKEIIKKAKELDSNNKLRIVQRRSVDRNWRLELGVNYGMIAGGDPYTNTQNVGGNLDVHINPMWSVGARYFKHYNELTPEGKRVFNDAAARASADDSFDTTLSIHRLPQSQRGGLADCDVLRCQSIEQAGERLRRDLRQHPSDAVLCHKLLRRHRV